MSPPDDVFPVGGAGRPSPRAVHAVPPMPTGPTIGRIDGRARPCPQPRLVDRWSSVYTLDLSVANAATEQIAGPILHQPFRVDAVHVAPDAVIGADLDVSLAFGQDSPTAGSTGDPARRPLDVPTSETATGQLTHGGSINNPVAVGTIIRNVPGRFVLTATNGTAGAVKVTARVSVTFLAPAADAEDLDARAY